MIILHTRQVLKTHEPVYQAIWVDNIDFDEVLISPAMIQDHMPDTVLAALNKVSRKILYQVYAACAREYMQCYTTYTYIITILCEKRV